MGCSGFSSLLLTQEPPFAPPGIKVGFLEVFPSWCCCLGGFGDICLSSVTCLDMGQVKAPDVPVSLIVVARGSAQRPGPGGASESRKLLPWEPLGLSSCLTRCFLPVACTRGPVPPGVHTSHAAAVVRVRVVPRVEGAVSGPRQLPPSLGWACALEGPGPSAHALLWTSTCTLPPASSSRGTER